jgi:hypothetical protein
MGASISVRSRSAKTSSQPGALVILLGLLLFPGGCGAPGEPQPLSPPVPSAITDLAAHQQGSGVALVFTMPGHTTTGQRLAQPPATEIFRGTLKPDGKPDDKSFRLVYTIPGELAHDYTADGKIQFIDPIAAEELRAHPGMTLAYRVRTRAAKNKDSADSNTVTAALVPVPEKIAAVDSHVTQNAIELSWPVPEPVAGTHAPTITAYRIYRGELDAAQPIPAAKDLSEAKWASPLSLLAEVESNSYDDRLFDFGKTYVYVVRSVTTAGGKAVESDDSVPAILTPKDTFPPATPQNVVAVVLPGLDGGRLVDLSWSINLETDLAGYRVYRSEKEGERGQALAAQLLLSPAFRDDSVQAGRKYWYSVTAVDHAGNESGPSEPVLADLTQPLP